MNKNQIETLKKLLNVNLSETTAELFNKYEEVFLSKNSHTNLISKNDEKLLFEKHIFDSLAINKFIGPTTGEKLLDIGTGGGFPSIPVAILYPDLDVYAVDSIAKKIKILDEIKSDIEIKNLHPICERVEKLEINDFNYITTRAVAPLDVILKYAIPKLKVGGFFIAYKSKKALDELKDAKKTIQKSGLKMIDIIDYTLPLDETYERNLIIFKKLK